MKGDRLAELRKDAGLTQEELGKVLNVANFSISAYECEKNEPADETKVKIAEFFGVTVEYLIGASNNPKPYIIYNNSIRLPKILQGAAEAELKRYIDYLVYKYKIRGIK